MSNFYCVVLVTGSREEQNRARIASGLQKALGAIGVNWGNLRYGGVTLVHGAAKGADSLTASLAHSLGWEVVGFPAKWETWGPGAGPIRNTEMVEYVKSLNGNVPKVVVAFPKTNSIGTWDCIKKSNQAGFPVWIEPEGRA